MLVVGLGILLVLAAVLLVGLRARSAGVQGPPVNLALDRPYTVTAPISDPLFEKYQQAYPDTGGLLTNGKFGSTSELHSGWVGFSYQDSRTVDINLGRVGTVESITANFLNDTGAGVFLPPRVVFSVSLDGRTWQRVGDQAPPIPVTSIATGAVNYQVSGVLIRARYVRVQFAVTVSTFIDEIQVNGRPGVIRGSRAPITTPDQNQTTIGYATTAQAGGVHNVLLAPVYLGSSYNQTKIPWNLTAAQWLPMVAYLSPQGTIQGWYFDTILAALGAGAPVSTMTDWQNWINHLFSLGPYAGSTPPTQLAALNEAVGQAKAALGDPAYQENVIIAIPDPSTKITDWGSLGGQTLDFTNTADREAAVDWFIAQVEQAWKQSNYPNLHLAGFYWTGESIYVQHAGSVELVQHTAATVHAAGARFYWIPFFGAAGVPVWKQLGFDAAFLQPNYAFSPVPDNPIRLTEAAELARHYGMGLEMEFPYAVTNPTAAYGTNRYLAYQNAALAYGFAHGVPLAWYQNTQGLLLDYQGGRAVYDLVHAFIAGKYTPTLYQRVGGKGTLFEQYLPRPSTQALPPAGTLDIPTGLFDLTTGARGTG